VSRDRVERRGIGRMTWAVSSHSESPIKVKNSMAMQVDENVVQAIIPIVLSSMVAILRIHLKTLVRLDVFSSPSSF
jgi:hypothetical protein